MIDERTSQLQHCMYQYSRAIYRSIKDRIDPYSDRETQLESRRAVLEACEQTMERLAKDPTISANSYQHEQIVDLQDGLSTLARITESIRPAQPARFNLPAGQCALDEIARQSVKLYLPHAQQCNVTLTTEMAEPTIVVRADSVLLSSAINALLRFAISDCKPGGQVSVTLGKTHDNQAHMVVNDTGEGYSLQQVAHLTRRTT